MMLILNEQFFIGKGNTRSCYYHPEDSSKCIKVFHSDYDNVKKAHSREVKELRKLSKRSTRLLTPNYYGKVKTSLGVGHVFDLVIKPNGESYPTLQSYVELHPEKASELLNVLREDLKQSGGVFHDLRTDNILVLDDGCKFAVIDGFGDWAFLKICGIFPYLAKKKVDRKLVHVERAIKEIGAEN